MGDDELWERLEWLNEGGRISYVEPDFDAPGETWFRASGNDLRVFSIDTLYKETVALPGAPCVSRAVYYHKRCGVFVELAEYPDELVMTFAVNNGDHVQTKLDPGERAERVAHYRELGFRQIGSWHVSPGTVLAREYRDDQNKVVVKVDGTDVFIGREEISHTDRAAAEATAEQRVAELAQQGYRFHLMESWRARHENPPEVDPVKVPALRAYEPVGSPNEAVDQAIAKLTEIDALFRHGHLIVELLDVPADGDRLRSLGHGEFFTDMHAERIGRWRRPAEVEDAGSSFDYFVRRYGSVTWVMTDAPDELDCFYCGNVSGGGWSPLEIRANEYDTEDLAAATGNAELAKLHVFHGGWHHGHSYAFDTRFASPEGEHPIVYFDESDDEPLPEQPATIEPFGYWLLRRVDELVAIAVPWLATVQD